jgi:hypothetical protein
VECGSAGRAQGVKELLIFSLCCARLVLCVSERDSFAGTKSN